MANFKGNPHDWKWFYSAFFFQILGSGSAAESNCSPRSLRTRQYGDGNRCKTECLFPPRREDSHQLPRHLDLSQRLPGVSRGPQAQLEASEYFVNMLELQ